MKKIHVYIPSKKEDFLHLSRLYVPIRESDFLIEENSYSFHLNALYWLWKNKQDDIIGLSTDKFNKYLSRTYIKHILNDKDVIVPESQQLPVTILEDFENRYPVEYLYLVCDILESKDISYFHSIESILNSNILISSKAFITSKEIFNDYVSFLFDTLKTLEGSIPNMEELSPELFDSIEEKIWNLYLNKKELNLKEVRLEERAMVRERKIPNIGLKNMSFI